MKIINEGLDYHDLEGIVDPTVSVDEYAAHMGKDSDIITLAFTVHNKHAGDDLSDWFERGYDFVLDAQTSEGEVTTGKYLVFVEMNRRTTVPQKIVELLSDLKTLTGLDLSEWVVTVDGEDYDADPNVLKQVIVLSPQNYRSEKEGELNEMRELAGLDNVNIYDEKDAELKAFTNLAGL
jgi:hypothetical protein